MAKVKDKYAQIGYLHITESGANTLTFNGLSVFSNVLSQQAMLLHRVEYSMSDAELALLAAAGDGFMFGLAGADDMSSVTLDSPEVYDYNFRTCELYGAAANLMQVQVPWVKEWSGLPGGGMLVPADRVFCFIQGVALAGAASMSVRFWFTLLELAAADYLELAQSMRVLK